MADDLLIYPERLSTKALVLHGRFAPGSLERLEDSLANGDGELNYRLTAGLDPQRRKVLSCIIEGFVFLTCQNSLEVFRHPVQLEERLVLVDSEAQLPALAEESDEEDYLVADQPVDIRDIVEDAVLLSLPMFPRKPGLDETKGGGGEAPPAKESPFAALESLKRRK